MATARTDAENEFLRTAGVCLGKRRVELGLTQEEVASRAGMDAAYVGQIERGIRNPTLLSLGRIAEALEIDLGSLFPGIPAPPARGAPGRLRRN